MYRLFLRLYPTSFRHEYGREMLALFSRQRRDAQTPTAVVALWLRVIVDTCVSAATVHADILRQDVRYTIRVLRQTPGFAATAIAVLMIGIGATTAAVSVADYVLVRPLPFPEPDRLVRVSEQRPGGQRLEVSPANYGDWRQMADSYETMAAYRGLSTNLVGSSQPLRIQGAVVTADVWRALRVRPFLGRVFSDLDDRNGAPGTVILSYALWQREFSGNPSVVGTTIRLDDRAFEVIGVMPRAFHFPNRSAQIWTPMRFAPGEFVNRDARYVEVLARLRPGVSVESARAEMDLIAARVNQQHPKDAEQTGAGVFRLRDEVSPQSRLLLFALLGTAGCVLLIACANLANLLLARAIARRREMAVRVALGAGRERLARQLLTESVLLNAAGATAGIALAAVVLPTLSRLVPSALPIAESPSIDLRMLAVALMVTLVTSVGFAIVPLIHHLRDRSGDSLRATRGIVGRGERARAALVVAEITASVVLLVVCGLLLRALWSIRAIDPGFTTDRALTVRTSLPMPRYQATASRTTFYSRVLSELRQVPGVSNAAYISFVPMSDTQGVVFPVRIGGVIAPPGPDNRALLRFVTPGVFTALAVPLHRGRDVAESDTNDAQYVAVVSESFARRFYSGQDPIGRTFDFAGSDRTIVGIVGDVKVRGLTRVTEPQVYLPYQQVRDRAFVWSAPKDLVVRTVGDPEALVPTVRAIVHKVDADVPLSDIQTLQQLVDGDTLPRVSQLQVLGSFACIALLLVGVGVHGLLAFAVSLRTAEIGVRMALGARRRDIVAMIATRSLILSAVGISVGAALAYAAANAMRALLAGIAPGDTLTFAAAATLTSAMAIAGSVRPALNAARVDPITVIRLE